VRFSHVGDIPGEFAVSKALNNKALLTAFLGCVSPMINFRTAGTDVGGNGNKSESA